jgi:Holliday junction resolvase RusA-like endonuclease
MLHLEFTVVGVPITNQQSTPQGRANLTAWRGAVIAACQAVWNQAPLPIELKAILINFYNTNRPSLDLDNMSKPVFDSLEGTVYLNDRQIRQAELTHVSIGAPFVFVGASPAIVTAVQTGNAFVYVRIEDPVVPFPLPG